MLHKHVFALQPFSNWESKVETQKENCKNSTMEMKTQKGQR